MNCVLLFLVLNQESPLVCEHTVHTMRLTLMKNRFQNVAPQYFLHLCGQNSRWGWMFSSWGCHGCEIGMMGDVLREGVLPYDSELNDPNSRELAYLCTVYNALVWNICRLARRRKYWRAPSQSHQERNTPMSSKQNLKSNPPFLTLQWLLGLMQGILTHLLSAISNISNIIYV